MTLGELRKAYMTISLAIIALNDVAWSIEAEIDIDLSDEWAILVRNKDIYLEFNSNDELFKVLIKDNDIRQAMHTAVDMSNNEDQGDWYGIYN